MSVAGSPGFRQQLRWAFALGMIASILVVAAVASTEEQKLHVAFGRDATRARTALPVHPAR